MHNDNYEIITGDALEVLKTLPDEHIQCCVTSPPYFGLRDYGVPGQLGLEQTPEEYVNRLVEVFREVRRVLRDDGVLWLNLGDSYAGSTMSGGGGSRSTLDSTHHRQRTDSEIWKQYKRNTPLLKPKDLVGIPWMAAFALRADGWYLRSDIIWHKPNAMPESVKDRPTKAHEYIFLLSKSGTTQFWTHPRKRVARTKPKPDYVYIHKETGLTVNYQPVSDRLLKKLWRRLNLWQGHDYYYNSDSIKEPAKEWTGQAATFKRDSGKATELEVPGQAKVSHRPDRKQDAVGNRRYTGFNDRYKQGPVRNKRTVWSIPTKPFPGAHFAVFPPALIDPCILAGSKPGDIILDPFAGASTTGLVALKHGRRFLGIELNPEYVEMSHRRIGEAGTAM